MEQMLEDYSLPTGLGGVLDFSSGRQRGKGRLQSLGYGSWGARLVHVGAILVSGQGW
jgi:hypothetical protein